MTADMCIVLRNQGKIDPGKIDDYLARGGYQALEKSRLMPRDEVIKEVKNSNLRGRGGAGFNCGLKWSYAASNTSPDKFVVCNADEGEPGTYKDRVLIESDPHSLIEGMAICAYAVRAAQGFIYLRGEYLYLYDHLNKAISQAKEKGLLDNLDINVRRGAGAYISGEETALLESLEGKRGEPRYKPPYPPAHGLWARPTVINNVETLANIPAIICNGADWYRSIGASSYPGTKLFSLSGDIVHKTIFELPTGTTIREVIFRHGGGIPDDKKIKAIQVGGTSGAIIPPSLLDTPLDFDSMRAAGATLGSGAIFVMDETRDIINVITRMADFFRHESCGKCTPCREGTPRLVELLEKVARYDATDFDLALIKKLGRIMSVSSLCGLGQSAPRPVISALEHFAFEFENRLNRQQPEEI